MWAEAILKSSYAIYTYPEYMNVWFSKITIIRLITGLLLNQQKREPKARIPNVFLKTLLNPLSNVFSETTACIVNIELFRMRRYLQDTVT